MKVTMYSIYDRAAKTYTSPWPQINDEVATRTFEAHVADRHGNMYIKPQDFTLVAIGTFDDEVGVIEREEIRTVAHGDSFSGAAQ